MGTVRLILGDQLDLGIASLADIDPENDLILMAELKTEATYVKHHKKKIAFIFSAMRHFAEECRLKGWNICYIDYDNPDNKGDFISQLQSVIDEFSPDALCMVEAGEFRLRQLFTEFQLETSLPFEIRKDTRFFTSEERFRDWADGRTQLRMEYFYRELRRETNVLMSEDGTPIGGKWNYDSENRVSPDAKKHIPSPTKIKPDEITKDVIALVGSRFSDHFGSLESFHYAVTRKEALLILDKFMEERLINFGTFQDAMLVDEAWMYHSHIGLYLNIGLLSPKEVVSRAEQAFYEENMPLNSVEGFIRQILGWREYVRGLYWYKMPEYAEMNYLELTAPLPDFYWSAQTDLKCVSQSVAQTRDHAYAHHIQRLMVLGNYALLTGVSPEQLNNWFLSVYVDAYEWVELPNVSGMVLFADGGILASKPYVSGGAYIDRMSNYCGSCKYNVKKKTGEDACPFNYLYWNFLMSHEDKFKNNPRMGMMYRTLSKMSDENRNQIQKDSQIWLNADPQRIKTLIM